MATTIDSVPLQITSRKNRAKFVKQSEAEAYNYMTKYFTKDKLILIAACLGIPFYSRNDKYDIATAIIQKRDDLFTDQLWVSVKSLFKMMKSSNNYNFDVIRTVLTSELDVDVQFWAILFGSREKDLDHEWEVLKEEALELVARQDAGSSHKLHKLQKDIADFESRGLDWLVKSHLRYYKG